MKKNKFLKLYTLSGAVLLFGGVGYSQSNNVVSAAIEYQKFEPSLMMQNIEEAKEHIVAAKGLIDKAMAHDATKNDAKANYYNVIINFGMISMAGMDDSGDLAIYQTKGDSIQKVIETSIEKASSKGRWKSELQDYFNRQIGQAVMVGEMMFKQKNYEMAFLGFAGAYELKKMAKIQEEQEDMKVNALISARNHIDTLSKMGEKEKAMEFVSGALEMFPGDEGLAIDGVNLALGENDLGKAEEFFKVAAEASPENKSLYSNMGSIYLTIADKAYDDFSKMDIIDAGYQEKSIEVEDLYQKSEKNLKRAIEIDPDYPEALYNLGVLYLGRGEKLKNQAGQMDFNNPDYDKVMEQSQDFYKKATVPLESYIKHDPNNAGVLQVLFQVFRNAGDNEKALEYKKRADALQGE